MLVAAALVTVLGKAAAAEPIAGYDRLTVTAAHRPAPLAASVWYPAGTPTYPALVGDNAVFKGTRAYVGAAVADGQFPVFVLSHGSGGNMDTISWLSSKLALSGALVLAVNHPGSTGGDSSPRRSILLDERAKDLSAALDALFIDPTFGPRIDPSRIIAIGFSLGGTTALNMAGIRFDRRAYADYCARLETAQDCVFLAKGGVDFDHLPDGFAADMRDPRVDAAVAIEPGMTYAVTVDSAAATTMPVLLINLGNDTRWKAVDVSAEGSDLVGRLSNSRYVVVSPGYHFTFLAECKPAAREILIEEADDPVCDDPEGTDRARAHQAIIEAIADFVEHL
jgi:predicted dienelactone hydrolase